MFLKAGKHTVEFVYEPRSYYTGKTITLITVPVVLALMLLSGFIALRKKTAASAMSHPRFSRDLLTK